MKDASQLAIVKIGNNFDDASGEFTSRYPLLTYGLWQQIQAHQEAFSKIFVWSARDFNLARGGQKRFAHGIWVSGEFFETLGVQPLVGRLLTPQDEQPGCGRIGAVISYAFWPREYGGSESVLGKRITLDGYSTEIIGVTPANFYGIEVGKTFDVAVPVCSEAVIRGEWSRLNVRHAWWLAAMGRLKSGWTIEKASAQIAAISPGAMEETLPQGYVLVQPEMERGRSPLVSIPPLGPGFPRHRYDHQAILQHGCVPAEPASISPSKIIVAPTTSIRLNFRDPATTQIFCKNILGLLRFNAFGTTGLPRWAGLQ